VKLLVFLNILLDPFPERCQLVLILTIAIVLPSISSLIIVDFLNDIEKFVIVLKQRLQVLLELLVFLTELFV